MISSLLLTAHVSLSSMAKAAAPTQPFTPSSSQASVQPSSSDSANYPQTEADRRAAKEKAEHDRIIAAAKAAVALENELEAACHERIDRGRHIPAGYKHDSRSNGICRCGSRGC